MKPEIKTLLDNLEFNENAEKPRLFSKKLEEKDAGNRSGVTAYIDFRRATEKGRRFYTVDGIDGFFDQDADVDTIPVLLYFKNTRDDILTGTKQSSITQEEHIPDAHETALAKIRDVELTPESIIKYLCPDATFEEAVLFLQVCKHRNLNPFVPGEVFLIKYDKTQPASTVVGKYAFTKKADAHQDFRGYTSGIIVLTKDGNLEEREGTFYLPKGKEVKKDDLFEILLGGWARVKRSNREDIIEKVSLQECIKLNKDGQPTRGWRDQPATMIRKVALVRALREAFPAELGGLYDLSEIQEVNP